jgi:LacI family transcriptional regulator
MGYVPNPLLAAYQATVRTSKPVKFQASLGWINDHPEKEWWDFPWIKPMRDGARARAAALGYALDELWIPDVRKDDWNGNAGKWQRILKARGIFGVILPMLDRAHHGVLAWEGYSVVCIGRHHLGLEKSTFSVETIHEHHRVNSNDFANTHLALLHLRKAGCRRIGLAISVYEDRGTDTTCSAAYLRAALEWPVKERLPILFSDYPDEVEQWARKHKPDAVLCAHSNVPKWIKRAGLKIPGDVRIAHLNLAPDVAGWSGIDRRLDLLGSAAVDLLSAHLQRNERGVPPYAKEMLIEGVWVEGKT